MIVKGLLAVAFLFTVMIIGAMTASPVAASDGNWVDNEGWRRILTWPGTLQTNESEYTQLLSAWLPYIPPFLGDDDRITFNFDITVLGGAGTVYVAVYRNGVPTGMVAETSNQNWWNIDNDNHNDMVSVPYRAGWTGGSSISLWGKATAGVTCAITDFNVYAYDNTAMVFENNFENGDTDEIDDGTGTEDDPFIVENKYIYTVTPHDDNGIEVSHVDNSWWIIRNCRIVNADYGIYVENASNGIIQSNVLENCNVGIYLKDCDNITIFGNRLENSVSEGIHLVGCGDVTVYYNYFENSGTRHAYDNETNNWDAGGHGNYWDDWQPPTYPEIGDTGIISLPRPIYGGFGVDSYPLVIAAGAYGTVVSISPGVQSGVVGDTVSFTVSVQNLGWNTVTYDLSTSDVEGWTISLQSTVTVGAYDTEAAAMNVVVSSATAVGGSNTITVTATSQTENYVTDSSTCIVIVTITPDVGISSWAANLAIGLGISEDSAGIMMSAMLMMAFLLPMGYIGFPMEGMIAFIIVLVGLTTALGWMPVWIAIMVGIGFALILARQLSDW